MDYDNPVIGIFSQVTYFYLTDDNPTDSVSSPAGTDSTYCQNSWMNTVDRAVSVTEYWSDGSTSTATLQLLEGHEFVFSTDRLKPTSVTVTLLPVP